jgi:hypothetical protein
MLNFGFRFNWGRPHLTKWFTREREIFIPGYALFIILWAWYVRKNKIRPLYRSQDYHLHSYDNPSHFSTKYQLYIPFNASNYINSAHYIEINRIFHQEMMKKFTSIKQEITNEFNNATEKEQRTKYATNSNYVYEAFGWEK